MIKQRLEEALAPEHFSIEDQSHLHAGHAGAQSGRGHFAVVIVSEQFKGKSLIQQHRMVYEALGSAMQTDIHALSIKSFSPEEYSP